MATAKRKMATPRTKKQWTVMVYLAGDNNLDGAGVVDLKEMKQIGSTDQVNVIAQFDRRGAKSATQRYYLRQGGTLEKDVVARLGETNTGDPRVLGRFLEWGFKNYPAQHHLVVLWNHGAGWDDEDIYRTARKHLRLSVRRRGTLVAGSSAAAGASVSIRRMRTVGSKHFQRALFGSTIEAALRPGLKAKAIAFDDTSKDFLDNLETKRVLASARKTLGRKIDILGMDACLMSMAEVCYQIRDSVHFTVGSEEVEPGDGWPYHKVLGRLVKKPGTSPEALAKIIVDEYLASYGAASNVTQSACDLTQAKAMAEAIDRLGRTLTRKLGEAPVRIAILEARDQVQSYEVPDYIDLLDFCQLLDAGCNDPEVSGACLHVKSVIADRYVVRSGFKGAAMQHSNGCAIYFPQRGISPLYATLDFARHTAWDEFVRAYLNRPRHAARTMPGVETVAHEKLAAKGSTT